MTLVVLDADVLGRRRTGEETYVANLLRELPAAAPELRFAAVTRHPELVPEGVEPLELPARLQEMRMAWSLPRLLRRLRPALGHFQHVLPLGWRGRSVVTLHDLHFERDPSVMGLADRLTFKTFVPRAARRADHVIAVSERTKRDALELYGLPDTRVTVTPHGVDPAFSPGGAHDAYLVFVGAVQARKDPLAAADAARAVGLPLVVVGPYKDAALAEELRRGGARLEGYVTTERLAELYRGAACLVQASSFEGFGLPIVEAMASGTPVVAVREPALVEVAGDAAVVVDEPDLADGIRRALAERERLVAAGVERARAFTWRAAAERTLAVYREILGA